MLRPRRLPVALAIVVMLALPPVSAHADGEPETDDGLRNLFRYASCAVSVYVAQAPGQWVLAFTNCAATYLDAI